MCWIKYWRFPEKDSEFSRVFSRVCEKKGERQYLRLAAFWLYLQFPEEKHIYIMLELPALHVMFVTLWIFEHDWKVSQPWCQVNILHDGSAAVCVMRPSRVGGGMMNDAKCKSGVTAPSAFITFVSVSAFRTKGGQVQASNCYCSVVWPFVQHRYPQ